MKKAKVTYWAADTENTVPRSTIYDKDELTEDDYMDIFREAGDITKDVDEFTRVWATGIAPVKKDVCRADVKINSSIKEFMQHTAQLEGRPVVLFHNFAYDGKFILTWAFENGYVETMNGRNATDAEKEYIIDFCKNYSFGFDELNQITVRRFKKASERKDEYEKYKHEALVDEYNKFVPKADIPFAEFANIWEYVEQIKMRAMKRDPDDGEFMTCISGDGIWYSMKIRFPKNHKVVEFRDSLKILPFSVNKIAKDLKTKAQKLVGSIDYAKDRPLGYEITQEEEAYIANDVLVMAEALAMIEEYGLLTNLTIGSACMKDYMTRFGYGDYKKGKERFKSRAYFPELDRELDAKLRKAYHGGFCYNNTDGRIYETRGYVYDVCSLYPSVMHGNSATGVHFYPVGFPTHFDGADFDKYDKTAYFIHVLVQFQIKPKHLPCVQIKNSRWADNEYIMDSEGIVELTFCRPDWELFNEQYDIQYLDIIEGWSFDSRCDLFDDYIEYWYHLKATAPNPVIRLICKLMLNNLYGKFATSPKKSEAHFRLEDGLLKSATEDVIGAGVYIPVGAFITAYARCVTIRAAQKNYENFLYADTDSLHLKEPAVGIQIGKALGEWDNETCWTKARFVRQKTYIEYTDIKDGQPVEPFLLIRACGASEAVKERLLYKVTERKNDKWVFTPIIRDENDKIMNELREVDEVIERFTYGLVEAGKLAKKTVDGGCILHETLFSINKPKVLTNR